VFYCIEHNKALDDLSIDEYKSFSDIIEDDIYTAISMETCVNDRKVIGGPAEAAVNDAIKKSEEFLKAFK
ncbi:MAG: argininosuccinate lyase, partial [Clostridia bacterium]|nr:argininosuccinate lyase [Clostridia bacterium]